MDFEKLLEKYSNKGERTVGNQIIWLSKQGIQAGSIDFAISSIYKRLGLGETFADGHELDQELRRVALDHQTKELEKHLDLEWDQLSKFRKLIEVMKGKV